MISTYGRYGRAPLISTQCPVSSRIPRAWASSAISATNRDLPTPGSPATKASLPCPASVSSTSRRRLARSASRSTNGVSTAGTALGRTPTGVSLQATSYRRQRSGKPRSQKSPKSRNDKSSCGSACLRTSSEVRICPPTASTITCAAACTACPYRSPSRSLTWPVWIPMRISTARCGSAMLCSSNAAWMAAAARTAATVDGKEMRNPSPMDLRTLATERRHLLVHDRRQQCQDVIGVQVATGPPQRGRADDVGHHDRERRGRTAAIRQGLPPW